MRDVVDGFKLRSGTHSTVLRCGCISPTLLPYPSLSFLFCLACRWAWSTCCGTSTTPPSPRSPTTCVLFACMYASDSLSYIPAHRIRARCIDVLMHVCSHTFLPSSLTPPTPPTRPQIKHKLVALSGLKEKLGEMHVYLTQVLEGKLPVNNQVNTYINICVCARGGVCVCCIYDMYVCVVEVDRSYLSVASLSTARCVRGSRVVKCVGVV